MALRTALLCCQVCLCVFIFPPFSRAAEIAEPSSYEGQPIREIRFDAPSPMTRADIARLISLKIGAPLRLADIRAAIKRLYSSGRYAYIEVDTEPATQGVSLVFRTQDQWFVGPVEVSGKVRLPPSDGQLANAARLELGAPFNEEDVQTAVNNMRDLLQRNGLYLATVDPRIDRDSEHQQVSLTFRVDSGKRALFTTPVVTGDTRIPAADVAKATKYKAWFRWRRATEDNTEAGLQNVRKKYEKDNRLTASVSLDHMDYLRPQNRARPTIAAAGGPKIKIRTTGAKVSKGNLQKYIPVYDEGTVNRDLLVMGVRNLRDYFQNRGYFDAQVDFKTTQVNPDEQNITYVIGLGERHKLVRVDIRGNQYFRGVQIRERLLLQQAGFIRLRHGRYSQGFARRDEEAIQALYRDNGFRDCKVATAMIDDYKGKKGDVAVTLTIAEGPQYLVSNLTVDGIARDDKDRILSHLASIPGQPFSETSVGMDRDYLLGFYQSAGYPDAAFDFHVQPGPGPRQMGLVYAIAQGQPRYVRDVLISGLRTTRPRLVDPNILLKPGDPLSWTAMGVMQRRLYNLGVFDKVDMAIQNPAGDTQNKYVVYHITEGHRYFVAVGAGGELARFGGNQSSLDNPAGTTGLAPRGDLEVSRLNLWGLGHSLNFKSRYSTLDRRVSLNYLAPRYRNVDGRNISITGLYDNTRDVLTFTARRIEGSAQLSQKVSKATTLLYRYSWRDVHVDAGTLKINPLLIPLVSQPARLAMISASAIQDRRDDPANARRGIYNSGDLGLIYHYFGGNKNFLRFMGRNSYYKQVFGDCVVASNTEFGVIRPFSVTAGVSSSDYVPISERLFGGGSTSHRGFPYEQAGPRDTLTGFPLGGNALLFHSTELRFPFIGDNIGGVVFHDMGNVYTDLGSMSFRVHQKNHTDFNYMVHAAGFGIRYRTPLGPLRLDLAYSMNPPTFNGLKGTYRQLVLGTATPSIQTVSHFQFFFSIGQAF